MAIGLRETVRAPARGMRARLLRLRLEWRRRTRRIRRFGRSLRLLLAVFALLSVGSARAEPTLWHGTLALEFLDVGLPRAAITGVGVAEITADGPALATLGVAGGIAGSVAVPLSDPEAASLFSIAIAATLGSGSLGPFQPAAPFGAPQLTRNRLPVGGAARLCVLAPGCAFGPLIPFTGNGGQSGVGVGGLLTAGGAGSARFSLQAAPWTIGWASLTLPTTQGGTLSTARAGFAHGPWSFASGSTALPGGALQLVTPIAIASNSGDALPAFGVLTLRFVPEPRSLLLLAPGVVGLLALARTRRHQE